MENIDVLLEQITGIKDHSNSYFEDMKMILESNGSEKKDTFTKAVKEMSEWTKNAKARNKEIYDTQGDITKLDPNMGDVIKFISSGESPLSTTAEVSTVITPTDIHNVSKLSRLTMIKSLYSHFVMHKSTYMNAFKSGNETIKTVYVSGTWLIVSYLAELCIYLGGSKIISPDKKYGNMISQLQKVLSHPKFIEYANTADNLGFNTESILYETVLAVGTTIVSFIVALRLIVWNMYMMRTKISDKLKVTAEFLEKNANRLQKTNKKNKDKIASKQLKAVDTLNRISEKLRIKLDDEVVTTPPPMKTKPSEPSNDTNDDEDDDIEL